jgi:hypothetical protein
VKKKISIIKTMLVCLLLVVASLAVNTSLFPKQALAAPDSCTAPATTYGTDTMSVYVPTTATYTIWTRLQAPSSSANSILLSVDGTNCYNVGGDSSIPTGSWDWVDDYDGNAANLVNVSLSQGTHTLVLTGTESGVSIDRLIAVPLATGGGVGCTPTNTQLDTAGDNCAPLANTASAPPSVTVTVPSSSGTTVSGTTTISATATDTIGIASVQFELDGSPLGSPVVAPSSGSTYSTSWNTTTLSNNSSHTITAVATDTSGYTGDSTNNVSVTVNNSSGGSGGPATPTLSLSPLTSQLGATTSSSVSLSWPVSSDTDGSSLTGYHVYRSTNGGAAALISSPTGTKYVDECLLPSTGYTYTITAYDGTKASPTSTSLSVTTESQTGDVDGDNTVTTHDMAMLLTNFGKNYPPAEFDNTPTACTNTVVETHDMAILLTNFGK